MHIIQIDLANRRQVRQFLKLPFLVYQDIPQWVPPLAIEARQVLDPRHNPFFRHSDAAFFLAYDSKAPVGRIVVLDNRRYNEFNHERTAFFHLFECRPDCVATRALFDAAISWARNRGLTHMIGPRGFTALDGLGLLVKGFEHRPALGVPYHPPYYVEMIEAAGFEPAGDIVSGYLDAQTEFPARIRQLSERVQQRRGLRVAHFKTRRDLRTLVPRLQALYNGALEGTTGNVPLTDDEAKAMADQIVWFADPRLIKIVFKDDEPVGFMFAYPDPSAAIQRTRGRLFPLGWIDLLRELKRTTWVNINGAGIVERYRGLGGTAILFSEMHKSIVEGRFKHADLVQIGVDNAPMQRELRSLGIDFFKTHRLYRRAL
jgi:GNAT superfamily N-acetyltransferase